MFSKTFLFVLLVCASAKETLRSRSDQNSTTVLRASRASYYCEWDYWKNEYWTGLTQVRKKDRVRSFYDCAMRCCKNSYCASFDWNKNRKVCYEYNQNIGTDDMYYNTNEKGWFMGALTYKNGYSYV